MKKNEDNEVVKYDFSYSSEWTNNLVSLKHWKSYWMQQKIMEEYLKEEDSLLEIGPGDHFCSNYLKSKGINVTTIDIDKSKDPDINENIVNYRFPDYYDHIAAFEVFEHIPYKLFLEVLESIRNKSKFIYISLPIFKKNIVKFEFKLPFWDRKVIKFDLSKNNLSNHHFWAVNYDKYTRKKITEEIKKKGYDILKRKTFEDYLFFVLKNKH